MKLLEPVERYFEAWNSHDGGAIAACFDSGGGYTDPVSGQLPPAGISAYASGLFSAFPDLRFELHVTAVDGPHVVAQWTMTGTQSGRLNGLPPTEARIKLPGIDVITLGEAGLLSVEGYFDQRTLLEQLGVQVTVQVANVGPLAFGTSVHFRTSNTEVPGALSMTWIDVHDEAEGEEIKQRSRQSLLRWRGCPVSLAGWESALQSGSTPSPCGMIPKPSGNSQQTPSTRLRRDKCSRQTSARLFIPVSGFLITSIRSGSGVRSAGP